jgi:cytochrome c-type biogenesis protein CcmH
MIAFSVAAGCLILLALAFVIPPLLKPKGEAARRESVNVRVYRDQLAELDNELASGALSKDQYERSRAELERRLLEDVDAAPEIRARSSGRGPALALGALFPIAALVLYWQLGTPQALESQKRPEFTQHQVAAMVEQLALRMEQNPSDPQGWAILGRSYRAMGRFEEAARALGKAIALAPDDARLLADYADAKAMAQGGNLEGEPLQVIERALKLEPTNVKALVLAATAAEIRADYPAAVAYWQRLKSQLAPGSEDAKEVDSRIGEALTAQQALAAPQVAQTPAAASSAIRGTVKLSPELANRVNPSDTLFVYAQPVNGLKMPVAIVRLRAEKFPVTFELNDQMAMSRETRLSDHPEVRLVARVTKAGAATPSSGDLQGVMPSVKTGASAVELVIDQVIP